MLILLIVAALSADGILGEEVRPASGPRSGPSNRLSAQTAPTDPHADAERLARSGAYREALERFQSLAAADPRDLEARTWIARLLVVLGYLRQGEDVYRSILLEAPDHVEALVGLASVLTTEHRFDEARRTLARAEALAPDHLEVLAAQGRLSLSAEESALAIRYYERAARLAPLQRDLRLGWEEARRRHDHWVAGTYFTERFGEDATPASHSGELALNLRVNDRLRVFGRAQQERKLGRTDTRGGGGVEWRTRWLGLRSVEAHVLAGPDNIVLPRLDTNVSLGWSGRRTRAGADARYYRFDRTHLWAIGPALQVDVDRDIVVSASYRRALTSFEGVAGWLSGNSGDVRIAWQAHPRGRLEAGYARGIEDFDRVTIDRVGSFRADTVFGGLRLDLRSLTTIGVRYEHQQLEGGVTMGRLTARMRQSF